MPCPDCKDGFYYPLVGPLEPCQTCKGEICPEPPDSCPDCNDTNYHLGHPQGTPGPCPTCNDPPADIASFEGDSSKDVSFDHHIIPTILDFDRQCKTAFNNIVNKDHPRIYYSTDELLHRTIGFFSQHSRERRISILISEIQCQLNTEGAWIYNVNIKTTHFFEVWGNTATSWKTGVHLKIASVGRTE